jgi:hypothetical protein
MGENDDTEKDRELLASEGPKWWQELRQLIKEKRDLFNAEVKREALSWNNVHSDRISMTRVNDGVHLEVEFDESTRAARFQCARAKSDLTLSLAVVGGQVEFVKFDSSTGTQHLNKTHDIAYELLRQFLCC